MNTEDRFWSKVDIGEKNKCWEWKASFCTVGYGQFSLNYKNVSSHRMAWFLTYGEFPKLQVCHKCDNKACCNPNHLFLGTQKDNIHDAIDKGRIIPVSPEFSSRGESHCRAKLSWKEVDEIRKRIAEGESCSSISKDYSVSQRAIHKIKYNQSWSEKYGRK